MKSKRSASRILVAVRQEDVAEIFDALGFEFDAVLCHSLKEARLRLDASISVILCGLRFDRGMIFDLLRHAKTSPMTRSIPFYSIVESKNIFSPAILNSVQMAATVLGASGFIDLFEVTNTAGEPEAYERLRQIIRQLV
ncbi:MAG: hypothetical protein A3I66_15950 [Burkholderiales bacterium RIFCSPLOWO2_02_FULL_57_36]|nr:MAG: hypothetical protein A3I66_15950 [Burkholderiales bacterium RIFCSPLOWO2_02_FULL_57_36]